MKLKRLFAIMLLGILLANAAQAQTASSAITGLWLSKKQDVAVRIMPCASGVICGKIVWISPDVPQADQQNKLLCGTTVLNGFIVDPAEPSTDLTGGTVFVANKGDTYDGKLHLVSNDTLELRAYLGVPLVGKTKTFTRVNAAAYSDCATTISRH